MQDIEINTSTLYWNVNCEDDSLLNDGLVLSIMISCQINFAIYHAILGVTVEPKVYLAQVILA